MGKALVSMLTKFDRPSCQKLAYQLAVAINERNKSASGDFKKDEGLKMPEVESDEFLSTLRSALVASTRHPKSEQYAYKDLIAHASRRQNDKAADILRRVSGDKIQKEQLGRRYPRPPRRR